jgi:hypothetical protein
VTEKEFSITPVPPAVLVGPVQFNATNQGLITHELVVIKTDLAPDALPMRSTDSTKVDEEAAGTSIGEIEDIGPGQSASTVMNLPPGKYVLICNVENHYKAGMFAAFTVGSVAPTAVPSPTAAALPKSGGPPSDSTPVWIWLAAGLAVLGAATVWLRLTSKRSP